MTVSLPLKKRKYLFHAIAGFILIVLQTLTVISFGWTQAASENQLYSSAFYFIISASFPVGAAFVWYNTAKGKHNKAFFFYLIPLAVYAITWITLIIMHFLSS